MEQFAPLGGIQDARNYFQGARGSVYVQHTNGSTTGFRNPSDRPGEPPKLQPTSVRTVYTDPKAAAVLKGWLDDEYIGTKVQPSIGKDGKLQGLEVHATEDNAKRNIKAGQVLSRFPASMTPTVGALPLEIGPKGFESPMGESMRDRNGIHYGSPIVKVFPADAVKAALSGAAIPLSAGRGGGGAGGANNINPLSFQRLFAKGGAVKMPESYSSGNWKLI
jgi:hypothetical protein